MYLFSLKLPVIKKNDPLLEIFVKILKDKQETLKEGDIVVFSEKVVATSQGRVMSLFDVKHISEQAKQLAQKYDMDERLVEVVIKESESILGGVNHVLLTKKYNFLIANAGIDQSNAGPNNIVFFPKDPEKTAREYRDFLRKSFKVKNLGIIITDSRVQPLRKGTVGIAVAVAGFEPVEDLRGKPDIFNRLLQIKMRNIADDLTSAAQFLLGEADEQTPIVIIRDVNVKFTDNPTTSMEIEPEECLFMNILSQYISKSKEKGSK